MLNNRGTATPGWRPGTPTGRPSWRARGVCECGAASPPPSPELDVTLGHWPSRPGPSVGGRSPTPVPAAPVGPRRSARPGRAHHHQGDLVTLELRHRRHAEVENRIRNLKDCGVERFGAFAANAAGWSWCSPLRTCSPGASTSVSTASSPEPPGSLPYRLLHPAGPLVHRSRRVLLRLPEHWPWRTSSPTPSSASVCSPSDPRPVSRTARAAPPLWSNAPRHS